MLNKLKVCKILTLSLVSRLNPLSYVTFTTATLCASFILFRGFNTSDAVNTLSLLCGFLIIFTGVYLLNLSRSDPDGHKLLNGKPINADGVPTDGIASIQTRRSMQLHRSLEQHRLSSGSAYARHGDHVGLIHAFDEENDGFGLTDLTEDSDGDDDSRRDSYDGHKVLHQ